jgi:hypothetical protein
MSILKLTVLAEPALITFAIANPRDGNSAFYVSFIKIE